MQNAVIYKIISGTPSADKFYVLNTSVGINGIDYYNCWGGSGTAQGTSSYNYIGGGRLATNIAKANLENTSGTIWYWLKNTVNVSGNSTGCTDWFIGSGPNVETNDDTNTEIGKLRNVISTYPSIFADQSTWFMYYNILCSIESSKGPVYDVLRWDSDGIYWRTGYKAVTFAYCAIRSF